jgi:hypothetical protein
MSTCEFLGEYPGIVFSKRRSEAKIAKEGGEIVGEGITLVVPPGALPEGDPVSISLQACVGGPFYLPNDKMVFMSSVFLIEPPCVFHKSVTLSIDLFTSVKNRDSERIVFVTSPTKGIIRGESAQWIFKEYGTPNFSVGSKSGKIELKHFCFASFARLGMLLYPG